LVRYFPSAALCAIRGIKCELVVGVSDDVVQQQQRIHADWKVDGSRGVIQFFARE
jgi:hypothetical protein